MLKHLLLSAAAAATALSVMATVPPGSTHASPVKTHTAKYRAGAVTKDAPVTISIPGMSKDEIESTFTFINQDGGTQWLASEGFVYANTNEHTADVDVWAISPKIHFKAGVSYFVYYSAASDADCCDVVEVKYGSDNTVAAMTETLQGRTELTSATHVTLGKTLRFDQDTDLCFGLHVMTPKENAGGGLDFTTFAAGTPEPNYVNPKATMVDGKVKLTWDQPTVKNLQGDPDSTLFTYRVVRGDIWTSSKCDTLVTGLTAREWVDDYVSNVTPPQGFRYKVTAFYGGIPDAYDTPRNGDTTGSDGKYWTGGHFTTPFEWLMWPGAKEQIDYSNFLNACTVIDNDADGNKWKTYFWGSQSPVNGKRYYKVYIGSASSHDDYLVFPPVKVEKGKVYNFKLHTQTGYNNVPFDIVGGSAAVVDSLTDVVKGAVVIPNGKMVEEAAPFKAPVDGLYYLAIHVTGNQDLFVYGIECEEGYPAGSPDRATAVSGSGDPEGTAKYSLAFTTPTTDMEGNALTALTEARVLRDGVVINTWANPAVGTAFTYEDAAAPVGAHKYEIVAINAAGAGRRAVVEGYAGINFAAAPANVKAVAASDTEATITWDPVTTDVAGLAVKPEWVKYNVYRQTNWDIKDATIWSSDEASLLASDVEGTSITVPVVAEGRQIVGRYIVKAVTAAGESLMGRTDENVAVGPSLSLPWVESMRLGYWDTNFGWEMNGNPDARLMISDSSAGVGVDKDYGGSRFVIDYGGSTHIGLSSARVHIPDSADCPNPTARFYTYPINGSSTNGLYLDVDDGTGWKSLLSTNQKALGAYSKNVPVEASLKEYAGKDVRVRFTTSPSYYTDTQMDCFEIFNKTDKNLAVEWVNADLDRVYAGKPSAISVKVRNFGETNLTADKTGKVQLKREGRLIGEAEVGALDTLCFNIVRFYDTIPANATTAQYEAVLTLTDDVAADNTRSASFAVVAQTPRPAATALTAEPANGEVTLAWTASVMEGAAGDPVLDDFEQYELLQTEGVGGWTLIDADGIEQSPSGNTPGIDYKGKSWPWYIYDDLKVGGGGSWSGLPLNSYLALDGHKCLSIREVWQKVNGNGADDWAISPLLSGQEQTISFLATEASYINLYTSETGTDPADFTLFDAIPKSMGNYAPTRATYTLPEGTKYFAVRHYKEGSLGSLQVRIDNFTYTPALPAEALKGYNVYCDGQKVNDQPLTATTFTHKVADGDHAYYVKAVFDNGETEPTNTVNVAVSGLTGLSADEAAEVARYAADGREVDASYRGVVIVKYSDGSAKKCVTK